jgi:hypothetical protein
VYYPLVAQTQEVVHQIQEAQSIAMVVEHKDYSHLEAVVVVVPSVVVAVVVADYIVDYTALVADNYYTDLLLGLQGSHELLLDTARITAAAHS